MNAFYPGGRLRIPLLVGLVGGMGCADHKATAVVVAFSAEPGVQSVVKQVEISAARGAEPSFSQPYDVPSDIRFPATLTFSKIEDAPNSQSVLYKIVGMDETGKPRITRQARLGFVEEHTKLLRMPLEQSCLDHKPCNPDETCANGVCVPDAVDPGGLPDFTSNGDVLSTGGNAGAAGAGATGGAGGMGGTSGTSGVGGATGAAGTSGVSGSSGAAGAAGASGTSGSSGSGGAAGSAGAAGAAGTAGSAGSAGTSGDAGTAGTAGNAGTGGTNGNVILACDTPSTSADGSIGLGTGHGCAISAGKVRCWGANGTVDGFETDPYVSGYNSSPKLVPLPAATYTKVRAGDQADCATTSTGALTCWGGNYYGTLGVIGASVYATPIATHVIDFVVGAQYGCAVVGASASDTAGAVQCWGTNNTGQMGTMPNPSPASQPTPGPVSGVTDIVQLARGLQMDLTCARSSIGEVTCWGGDQSNYAPSQAAPSGALDITIGGSNSTLFYIDASHQVYSTLRQANGSWSAPAVVSSLGFVSDIEAEVTLCGVDNSDPKIMRCSAWPEAAEPPAAFDVPIRELGVGYSNAASFGTPFECATLTDGSAKCRGNDINGVLGIGKPENIRLPLLVDIQGAQPVSLTTSVTSTVVQVEDGSFWVWGVNSAFFGDTMIHPPTHVPQISIPETVKVSLDTYATFAYAIGPTTRHTITSAAIEGVSSRLFADPSVTSDQITMVASSAELDLGITSNALEGYASSVPNSSHLLPQDTATGGSYQEFAVGGTIEELAFTPYRYNADSNGHACIRLSNGHVQCWGANGSGETAQPQASATVWPPAAVKLDASTFLVASSICSGQLFSCAATSSGEVYCWGSNGHRASRPTNTTESNPSKPVLVDLPGPGPYNLACGTYGACAWTSTSMTCWGDNIDNQMGDPSVEGSIGSIPVHVTNMPPAGYDTILDVSMSEIHLCALVSGGGNKAVACWGGNLQGGVGVGPNGDFDTFQRVCSLD